MDRSMQPIYIQKAGTNTNNKMNAFMDHCWDGFYTCQKRLQRFVGLMEASKGTVTTLEYTGTPPKSQRFTLEKRGEEVLGSTIRIHFPAAMARSLVKGGKIVNYNPWNDILRYYGPIQQRYCGENRYIGVQNWMEFYITTEKSCIVEIRTRDAIMTNIRMEWTYAEFFADGGTTKMVDRIAASLGIHASEIKIVSVYEGSLIIVYNIFSAFDEPSDLERLRKKQIDLIARGQFNIGAPIIDSTVSDKQIVQNGVVVADGYEPIVIYKPTVRDDNNNNDGDNSGSSDNNNNGGSNQDTRIYNVQTGTREQFINNNGGNRNTDIFDGVKVITEGNNNNGRKYDQMQQQKLQQQIAAAKAKAESDKVEVREAEQRLQTMRVALITVVAVVLIGLTIYGMVKIVNSFGHPKQVTEDKKYVEGETEIKVLATDENQTTQYDATKDFNTIFNTQTKLKLEQQEEQENEMKLQKAMSKRQEMQNDRVQKKQVKDQMENRKHARLAEIQSKKSNPTDEQMQ